MKVVIFSGTTEGRKLSRLLAEAGAEVTACVASEYGGEEQRRIPGVETRVGTLSPDGKTALLCGAELCIDATHPYATHVTASVREACRQTGTEYLRLLRDASTDEAAITVDNAAAAAELLGTKDGNILLTTGAKELPAFRRLEPERLFPRVLPSHESLAACESAGIPHRNIIAMQGPFSKEMNIATIQQYQIRFLVTKDGGAPGGFPEKAAAAEETGVQLIVLRRPEEQGLRFDEVLNLCMSRLRAANIISNHEGEQLP